VTGTSAPAVIEVSGLSKSYRGKPFALRDVTLEVGPGVTGLLGPNGAGKSTLLQCVLGLLSGFSGEVAVLGLDARRERREIRRRVGYMPEADAYLPRMTAVTATRYLGELTGMRRSDALRRAHECLHYAGLTDALYRSAEEFSTGMRQRLKLAQALVHDPELLFLDEPVSGMDPAGREEFLRLVRSLARDHGKHVVWSSHLLPDVQRVADAVLVLDGGRLLGSFRLEELQRATGRWDVEGTGVPTAFEEALRRGGVEVEAAPAASGPGAPDGRFRRVARVPDDGGPEPILRAARSSGTTLRRVTPLAESLDEVFHRLIGDGRGARP
jgi:ABC-2 type transport system ATP-binding protein